MLFRSYCSVMCFWRSLIYTVIGKKWGMIQGCNCYYLHNYHQNLICWLTWKFHFSQAFWVMVVFRWYLPNLDGVYLYLNLEPGNFDILPIQSENDFYKEKPIQSFNPQFSHFGYGKFSNNGNPRPEKSPGFEDFIDLSWQDFRQQLLQVAGMGWWWRWWCGVSQMVLVG